MSEPGILFLVVGPSGAGKDSLIEGVRSRLPAGQFVVARRTVTRAAGSPGEDHDAADEAGFEALTRAGAFLITWQAHGLHYGLSAELVRTLNAGCHVIANVSRSVVGELAGRVARLAVLEVEAPRGVLEARIAARGREQGEAVRQRVSRQRPTYPAQISRVVVHNDLDLGIGCARMLAALRGQTGRDPTGVAAIDRKILGARLEAPEIDAALATVLSGTLDPNQRDAFLVACARALDDDELLAVARWRSRLMPRIDWGGPRIVDKHSLGGTAGSRVTLIVIPIVSAHGMVIPKTSSRAITSAAGTADAMEVLARVDLSPEELRRCVRQSGACIAWNGRLNHSVLDEAMHALERRWQLDTRRWSAASILSKKLSAGATDIVIDVPYAEGTKVRDRAAANDLAHLFESLGSGLGLRVRAYPTDGAAPIGQGIGPALEARDALRVLEGDPRGPTDLREKSLFFASRILMFDPAIADEVAAYARARELLESGKARRQLEAIIEAQGRQPPPDWQRARRGWIAAQRSGTVLALDPRTVNAIARAAGAPSDPLAGLDLLVRPGDTVRIGDPLFAVQACDPERLDAAMQRASADPGYRFAD